MSGRRVRASATNGPTYGAASGPSCGASGARPIIATTTRNRQQVLHQMWLPRGGRVLWQLWLKHEQSRRQPVNMPVVPVVSGELLLLMCFLVLYLMVGTTTQRRLGWHPSSNDQTQVIVWVVVGFLLECELSYMADFRFDSDTHKSTRHTTDTRTN